MQNCARCGFKKWIAPRPKRYKWVDGHRVRVWLCAHCSHPQAEEPPYLRLPPKVLYVDIEISPIKTYSWGLRVPSTFINPEMLINSYFVICWAASWMDEAQIHSGAVTGLQARKANDKQCLKGLWELIDDADIVAGHNAAAFDLKRINTRFLLNGYHKPRDYRVIDTLRFARSKFAFPSNSLEAISGYLGLNPKADMNLSDWLAIVERGDEKIIDKMQKYNIGDVREGKKVLSRFLPWVQPYPIEPKGGYKVA